MSNKQKLAKKFEQFKELTKQAEQLRESCDIPSKEYLFCCHLSFKNPVYSAWINADDTQGAANFEVIGDRVVINKTGQYSDDTIQEMKKIIEAWLNE